jgi:hypothetical protein
MEAKPNEGHNLKLIPSPEVVSLSASHIDPGMVIRPGTVWWTVDRVTKYVDNRTGELRVSAVGHATHGEKFVLSVKATARVGRIVL